jgi:phosphatidate cytidylyltransferase
VKTRLLAAAVGLSILIPALVWGGVLAVQVIVVLALAVCAWEYAGMAFPDDRQASVAWLIAGLYGVASVLWIAPAHVVAFGAVWVPATLLYVTLRPGPDIERAADRAGRHVLGLAWLSLLPLLAMLRALPDGLTWVFVVLGISWLGDTGGYFAGRFLGKHKLYERISPKKTVEGAVGGVVAATIGVFVITRLGGLPAGIVDCLLLGVVGCTTGILGDLAESMMKRSFGVKDAGTIMPGHGGLLDRIDSVLFVGAVVYGYAVVVMS